MRNFRRIALGAALFAAALMLGIRLYAWSFRIRAEHLLAHLKTFQIEETPAVEILRLRSQYRSHTLDQRTCSEEHCHFVIEVNEWESLMKPSNREWAERIRKHLLNLLRPIGLRRTSFDTYVQVEQGKLRKLDVRFMHAYAEHDRFPNFIARAITAGNFNHWIGLKAVYDHPNLLAWEPSACTGCSGAISADFTWQASRLEFQRALGFDLSCITRFSVCRTVEELSPAAAQLLRDDRAIRSKNPQWKLPCDTSTARILGRDSAWVDIARLTKIKSREEKYVVVDYELFQAIKGDIPPLKNIYYRSELADAVLPDKKSAERLLRVGSERIVFMDKILGKPAAVFECAVMPTTSEILAATREGVADRSGSIGEE